MNKFKFKSNIKCIGCLKKVALHLSTTRGMVNWDVELKHPNRILTVEGNHLTAEQIEAVVRKAGYKIEQIN